VSKNLGRTIRRIAPLIALVLLARVLTAQAVGPDPRWIALFERCYGTEGLYTVEMYPEDEEGASRLNLQLLNASARELRKSGIRTIPSAEDLVARGAVAGLHPHPAEESYLWDSARNCFESSLGGKNSTAQGALTLLRANADVRRRMLSPDMFVRQRWKQVYQSPDCPPFLKNEILLREFLLDKYEIASAQTAHSIQQTLVMIEEGIKLYAIREKKNLGDSITMEELIASRLIGSVERPPEGVEIIVKSIGEAPRATFDGAEITTDPSSVEAYHRAKVEKAWTAYPNFPPAIALKARFATPGEAIKLIDNAVMRWPGVPGMRIERMAHNARLKRFDAWREDLGYLLGHFPTAPVLFEMQSMAEAAEVLADETERARLATALADIRPDLLSHQLAAIQALVDSKKIDAARLIHARMVATQPGWAQVLPPPGSEPPVAN